MVELKSGMRRSELRWPSLTFSSKMHNIIPTSSEIIKVCKQGDLNGAQEELWQGRARPDDLKNDYHPLLWV